MTALDARYRAALPEFPLFELDDLGGADDSGAEDRGEATAPTSRSGSAASGAHRSTAGSSREPESEHGEPALVELALIEVDASGVLQEAEAVLTAVPAWAHGVGVFDLETTGVDPHTARIVSASVAVLDEEGRVVERKDWLADPGVEIPEGAAAVHGISTERARRWGRPGAEVVAEILEAIRSIERRGFPLVVYNAPYDLTLLATEAARHGLEPLDGSGCVVDPLVIDKALDRFRKGKRTLEAAAAVYGVLLEAAHDAAADAIAAGRVAQAIADRYRAELAVEAAHLHALQVDWCREQAQSFQEYMRRTKDPEFTTSGDWPLRLPR